MTLLKYSRVPYIPLYLKQSTVRYLMHQFIFSRVHYSNLYKTLSSVENSKVNFIPLYLSANISVAAAQKSTEEKKSRANASCIAAHYNALQYCVLQYSTVHYSAVH